MSRKTPYNSKGVLALFVGLAVGALVSQLFLDGSIFAQKVGKRREVPSLNDLEQKISVLEQQICSLDHKMTTLNQTMAKTEAEICAAERLVEISEKNLSAPNYVNAILFDLTVILGGLVIFIVRHGIIKGRLA